MTTNVLNFPILGGAEEPRAARERRLAEASVMIDDGMSRIVKSDGVAAAASVAVLLLLDYAQEGDSAPNPALLRRIDMLRECFSPPPREPGGPAP
jgi:hypothetical protein